MLVLAQLGVTWYLFPLAAVISLVYSATRYEAPARILSRAGKLFLQILFFMAVILGVLMLLSFRL
ncbi:MAG: hypothetical protein DWQ34_01405 [Planctomycetota bacterium]|nr:MAG: hypothetical protein DWQ29_01980 [Planctomycetota bacterium]REJ97730.1 MAG: hypothetical protein DWQ34_01405 [Planctomycetota bacterium]REK26656.1 MAG: hypothetical protein DWQ41_08875 [Planctomycetota bacterium]REK35685.1 MAG: hypothetical protein DWQ45_11080 [Planctomycetota bacterium]